MGPGEGYPSGSGNGTVSFIAPGSEEEAGDGGVILSLSSYTYIYTFTYICGLFKSNLDIHI